MTASMGNVEIPVAIETLYSEAVMSTLVNPMDITANTLDGKYENGEFKFNKTNKRLSFHYKHKMYSALDIDMMECLIVGKRWYTTPLILPNLPSANPYATKYTSSAIALKQDPEFKRDFDNAVNHRIFVLQNELFKMKTRQLEETVADLVNEDQIKFITEYPYHEVIYKTTDKHINAIKKDTERLLWHQRLGHPSDQYLYTAHKFINDVPTFKHFDPILDKCPVCTGSEQPKRPGLGTTKRATKPHQGFSIDFGFAGQARKEDNKYDEFLGFNKEKAWVLITDHFTDYKWGKCFKSKAPPINYLRDFLTANCPGTDASLDRYVFMDQGGELYRSPKVLKLF